MKYRLKKDLPFAKAGSKVIWDEDAYRANGYFIGHNCEDLIDGGWIEEVKPREWFVALNHLDEIIFCGKLNPQQIYDEVIKVREVIE